MAEASFSKSDTQECKNEHNTFISEIRQMMHGFGDCSEPSLESAKMIEDIVLREMKTIVNNASEVADRRGKNCLSAEDFLFLLRRDKVKLQRLLKYLKLKEFKASMNKLIDADIPEVAAETENVDVKSYKVPNHEKFLHLIDNTGELLVLDSAVDNVKQNRCLRAEMMARKMDEKRYLEFFKARCISFSNKLSKNNKLKFYNWVSPEGDITITKPGNVVLEYLAYETVAQIIDLALLVRQDQNKMHGDAIDRLRLSYSNNYKSYQQNKYNLTQPITPLEISEAVRRYWSPQLDMTGPFHRSSIRRRYHKLLTC